MQRPIAFLTRVQFCRNSGPSKIDFIIYSISNFIANVNRSFHKSKYCLFLIEHVTSHVHIQQRYRRCAIGKQREGYGATITVNGGTVLNIKDWQPVFDPQLVQVAVQDCGEPLFGGVAVQRKPAWWRRVLVFVWEVITY